MLGVKAALAGLGAEAAALTPARVRGLGAKEKAMIHRFEDMRIWQLARDVTRSIHAATRSMPKGPGIGDQMLRAAISIASNIAEGSQRGSDADFRRFLYMANGSCSELRAQLYLALDCGWIAKEAFLAHHDAVSQLGMMIGGFIRRLSPADEPR